MVLRLPLRGASSSETVARLERRIEDLEADMAELRRHNLRLAELTDVVQELVIPMASRDEEAVAAAIERFHESM